MVAFPTCVNPSRSVTYNHMVVNDRLTPSDEETDLLFHALADATRRDIVRRSLRGDHSVSDLARHYSMSFAAVQKHVAILERAQLITKRHRGRERIVCGRIETARKVQRLLDELEDIWRGRMERFGDVLFAELADDAADHFTNPSTEHRTDPEQGDPR